MWPAGLWVTAMVIIAITRWICKWRNPTCNGKLPPGSMGFPLIGETIQFFISSNSLDIPPFLKTRIRKYGPMFRTSLVGRPVVVSSDPDFNHFILQQEGKLVQLWYLDSFARLLGHDDSSKDTLANITGYIHKYMRNLILNHFGRESLKEKLLPKLEEMANHALHVWTNQASVELKHATSVMAFDFTSKELFGYDPEKSGENMSEKFTNLLQGFLSFPLNIPGTAFHRSLQNQKKALKMIREVIAERRALPGKRRGDFLDHIIDGMKKEAFLTDNFITYTILVLQFASFDTISSILTLTIKLLTEHPLVLQELAKENEEILRNRENTKSGMTWKEYKSMNFTMQIINESLRLGSLGPGFLRRVIEDIHVNGYTIPKDWTILIVPVALHLNPDTYEDPLTFNPWRWKDLGANITAKNMMPFGGGMRSCVGAEFSKVLMAVFLHVLVTKYRWTKVEKGEIVRYPTLGFGNGYHIKVSEKLK